MRNIGVKTAQSPRLHDLAMADAGKCEPHEHLTTLRFGYLDIDDEPERLTNRPQDGRFHAVSRHELLHQPILGRPLMKMLPSRCELGISVTERTFCHPVFWEKMLIALFAKYSNTSDALAGVPISTNASSFDQCPQSIAFRRTA